MFCTKCGNTLKDDAKFCTKCGCPVKSASGVDTPKEDKDRKTPPKKRTKRGKNIIGFLVCIIILSGSFYGAIKNKELLSSVFLEIIDKNVPSKSTDTAPAEDDMEEESETDEELTETSEEADPGETDPSAEETTMESSTEVPMEMPTERPAEMPTDMATEFSTVSRTETAPSDIHSADYILPESSTKYLTSADLAGLSKEELRLARNEIYARHGRHFQTEDLARYFGSKSWYHGYLSQEEFDEGVLNDIEKKNLILIKEVEAGKAESTVKLKSANAWYLEYVALRTWEEELKKQDATQAEKLENAERIYESWDSLLNEIYQNIKAIHSEKQFEKIREDEMQWIRERDLEAERVLNSTDLDVSDIAYFESLTASTKQRITHLVDKYLP